MLIIISMSVIALFSFYSLNIQSYVRVLGAAVLIIVPPIYYLEFVNSIGEGLSLFNGLFFSYWGNTSIEAFLLLTGGVLFMSMSDNGLSIFKKSGSPVLNIAKEYGLILVFSLIGISLLMNICDFLSLYLAIEFQSFGLYILASFYKNCESASSAGLKYFLLGGLSSAFILLGAGIIYSATGLTNLEGLMALITIVTSNNAIEIAVSLGLFFVMVGLLFKVAAAPFHQWAPDVYNAVPTIITSWLAVIPKISVLMVLFTLSVVADTIQVSTTWKLALFFCSLICFILGTVSGLNQIFIKRLLAFSTVAHVGFLLLALALYSVQSLFSFLFYLVQYSLTNVLTFFILLLLGIYNKGEDIDYIGQLKGFFKKYGVLAFFFAITMFSIAGVPPFIGFWGKYFVILSSIESGQYFIAFVAIITSVISASYYLQFISVSFFDTSESYSPNKYLMDLEIYSWKEKQEEEREKGFGVFKYFGKPISEDADIIKHQMMRFDDSFSEKVMNKNLIFNQDLNHHVDFGLNKGPIVFYFVSGLVLFVVLYMVNAQILVRPILLTSLCIFNA